MQAVSRLCLAAILFLMRYGVPVTMVQLALGAAYVLGMIALGRG